MLVSRRGLSKFERNPLTKTGICGEALNAAANSMAVYALGGMFRRVPKNTRLAIFGDAVAASHLCSLWFESGLSSGQ